MSGSWGQGGRCIGEWRREVVVVIKRATSEILEVMELFSILAVVMDI